MSQQPRHRRENGRSRLALGVSVLLVLLAVTLATVGFSSATFTSSSAAVLGSVRSGDWSPPTVSMQNPGSSVRGTTTLVASASDESGIKNVSIQYQAAEGAGWATVCTVPTTPYGCSWDTTSVADGTYQLRAVATDNSDQTATSEPVQTIVANRLTVVLTPPGEVVKGSVPLTSTVYNSGLAIYTTSVQYALSGTTSWKTACTNVLSTTCTWNTTNIDSGSYDLRTAVSVLLGPTYYSSVITDVIVDNDAPTVTMTDPGTPLSGTRTFAATASDDDSGVAKVVLQYATSGTSTYKVLCTITDTPFSCRFDTTTLTNGSYSFRAVATDIAGNTTTSAAVTNRLVDNTVSSVSVEDPGTYLSGRVDVTANAAAGSGIASVRIQRAPRGGSTWTDLCTATTAPYTCSWDTTTVADGSYDLRAVLLDKAGSTTISPLVTARIVDNSLVRGLDVQASNGSGTAGRLDSGDTLTYTFSERVVPSTISSGWDGSSMAVTFRLRDGNSLGRGNSGDTVDVLKGGSAVNLGDVVLGRDFIKNNKSATFNATLTAGTTEASGVVRTVVTVKVGSQVNGNGLKTVTSGNTAAMRWNPSNAVTDLAGNRCSPAPVPEAGGLDRDF
jgi:hypothetical protein